MTNILRIFHIALLGIICVNSTAQDTDWLTFPAAKCEGSADKGRPFRFANQHTTELTPNNSGIFESLADGSYVWTIGICSESSRNINVTLTDVQLGPSDELSVFSPDYSDYQTYTFLDVPESRVVQSLPVKGDSLVVRLIGFIGDEPHVCISAVNCGFIDLPEHIEAQSSHLKASAGHYGASQKCEVDASCYDAIADVKQSVCRLLIDGSYFGSGVLVDNTSHDGTPYVLTAAHLFESDKVKSCVAIFNFEAPFCQPIEPNTSYMEKIQGAQLIEYSESLDLAMLLLSSTPSAYTRPYWSGWNLSTDVSETDMFYCIHHPYGDVRKVSTAETVMANSSYTHDKTNSGLDFEQNNHWRVLKWLSGTTEGGSSGSGLFDSNMRLIGNLSGGLATCSKSENDYFWMLAKNWDILKKHLDPLSANVQTLPGAYLSNVAYHDMFSADNKSTVMKTPCPNNLSGYISGHNELHTTMISQKMGRPNEKNTIYGVYLSPFIARSAHAQSFKITLWNDKGGMPGEVIATKSVENKLLSSNKVSYIAFNKEIQSLEGIYHVGVELDYESAAVDTLAFYCQNGSGAHFYTDGAWRDASYFGSDDLSLFIGVRCVPSVETPTINNRVHQFAVQAVGHNTFDISGEHIESACVYDIFGRCVYETVVNDDNVTINLAEKQAGIYIIRVNTSNDSQTIKVINR